MMKTSTLLALSLAGLAATAGLACFVIVSASDVPSAVIAEEKERTVSRETAPEATPRLLPSPQSGKSRAARKADAPLMIGGERLGTSDRVPPWAKPGDNAATEPLFSHSKGLPEAPEEGTKWTKETQETSEGAGALSPLSSLKSEFPRVPLTTEKTAASSVPSVVKNKSALENTTLPQEPTMQTAPPPASPSPQNSSNTPAPLPSKRRPWPKGNFTPEQERYRAQYGWQTFSEAIVAEVKEEIAR